MAAGELAAAFRGLADDAGQAAESISATIARFTETTADTEDGNVARTLAADAKAAASARAAGGEAGPGGLDPGDPGARAAPDTGGPGDAGGLTADGNGGIDGLGGDPVDVVSGQMVTGGTDADLPGVLPLVLRRAGASGYPGGRLHGPRWSSTLDQRLEASGEVIRYYGDDAQVLRYARPRLPGVEALPAFGARWPLTWDPGSDTYLVEDPVTGWTRHFGPGPADPAVRPITALTDRNGNRVSYLRDAGGLPEQVVHSGGYQVSVGLVTAGGGPRIGSLVLQAGGEDADITLAQYGYDERGRLTEILDSAGQAYRYAWDDADRITAWTDRAGFGYRYAYGADGRVTRGEGDDGYLSAEFAYDTGGRVTRVTNSLGHVTAYHYDGHGHLTEVTDPLGATARTAYDRYHRLLSRTDPLGGVTRYALSPAGDLTRVDRPDGTVIAARWTSLHQAAEVTGPDGTRWQYAHDERGNLLAVTDPAGAVTRYGYGPRGELASVTDALGQVTTITANAAGLPLAVTGPDGASWSFALDPRGRVTAVTDPLGAVTRTEWAGPGAPSRRVHPDGTSELWDWDGNGDLRSHTSQAGLTTAFENGPFHLVLSRTEPDGTRHAFRHDTELRLAGVTGPEGLTWDYGYDPAGNLISERDFNGRVQAYAHDAAGQLRQVTNGAGQVITLTRDAMGRVTSEQADDAVTTFGYDPAGRLIRADGPDAVLALDRDPLGRVLAETVNGRRLASAYDPLGRRLTRTTPSGRVSSWQYGPAGQPVSLSAGERELTFARDAAGRETRRWLGPATALASTWDVAGQLTARNLISVEGPVSRLRAERRWTYRADGALRSVTDTATGTRQFDLDAQGRVIAVHAASWTERYAYDPAGNLASASDTRSAEATLAGPRTSAGTLLRQAGRGHYDYDDQGRLVTVVRRTLSGARRTWTYRYDARDRLTEAVVPGGQRWRYRYDPLGRRIAKQRLGTDGGIAEETVFAWDGLALAEQEHHDSVCVTAVTWDYQPGTWTPLAQDQRSWLASAPQDVVDARFHAIITDLVGTPTELVTPDGQIEWRQQSGLWGNTFRTADHDGDAECLLRFPGQYHDAETGLDYNVHRYYDPHTGRYTTPDPLGLTPSPNPHAYVPNPTTRADPLGLAGCGVSPENGFRTFYTVQGAEDAARLRAGGEPWPTSPSRAALGPGVYSFGDRAGATGYANALASRGASTLEIMPFQVSESDLASMRSLSIDALSDPEAFLSKYSLLWDGTPNHGYEWLMRGTQFGTENYFATSVLGKLKFGAGP